MEALLSVGLWNAVGALLLALVVACIGRYCRRPAVMHALWLLVLVKMVMPPLWPIPITLPSSEPSQELSKVAVPLPPQLPKPLEIAVDADAVPAARAIPDDEVKPATIPVEPQPELPPIPAFLIPPAPPTQEATQWQWTWVELAIGGWAIGAGMYWTLALVRVVRFRRALRRLTPAPDSLQTKTEHLAGRLGLRSTPLVFLLDAPISPMVWAFGSKARLLLPTILWETLSETQRELLLSHELAHLQRRDHWVRLFELLVVGLYWWLPVAWWARRRLQEAGESCCDACVLSLFPESAPDYASTLVDSAAFLSQNRWPSPLPVGASGIGHVPLLRRRLTMILSGKTPRGLSWASLGLLLIAAAVVLPLWPSPVEPAAQTEQPLERQSVPAKQGQAELPPQKYPQPPVPIGASMDAKAGIPITYFPGSPTVDAVPAQPPAPVSASAQAKAELRDQIDLLKIKVDMEFARLELAVAQMKSAQERLNFVVEMNQKAVISKSELMVAQQEVAAKTAALSIQRSQLEYEKLQLKQAQRRYDEMAGPVAPPPPKKGQAAATDASKSQVPAPKVEENRTVILERTVQSLQAELEARIKQFELLKKELDELRHKPKDGKGPSLESVWPPTDVTTPSRTLPIPYNCVVSKDIQEKDVRILLSVSRDEGRTWTMVKAGRPGLGQLVYEAPEDGLYFFKLEVEVLLNKSNRQVLDPTAGEAKYVHIKVRVKFDPQLELPAGETRLLRVPIELKLTMSAK